MTTARDRVREFWSANPMTYDWRGTRFPVNSEETDFFDAVEGAMREDLASLHDDRGRLFGRLIDHDSLEDGQITARDRDTMEQDRIPVEKAGDYLAEKLAAK